MNAGSDCALAKTSSSVANATAQIAPVATSDRVALHAIPPASASVPPNSSACR